MIDQNNEKEEFAQAFATEATDFINGLIQESDRALVVLGAARLDFDLEQILKQVMLHDPGGDDRLFSPDRPLGTFSAKITLAYRLGLIDRDIEHALQMVRKIRNKFAHSIELSNLSDSQHKNQQIQFLRSEARLRAERSGTRRAGSSNLDLLSLLWARNCT